MEMLESLATAVLVDYRRRNGRNREREEERMEGMRDIHTWEGIRDIGWMEWGGGGGGGGRCGIKWEKSLHLSPPFPSIPLSISPSLLSTSLRPLHSLSLFFLPSCSLPPLIILISLFLPLFPSLSPPFLSLLPLSCVMVPMNVLW